MDKRMALDDNRAFFFFSCTFCLFPLFVPYFIMLLLLLPYLQLYLSLAQNQFLCAREMTLILYCADFDLSSTPDNRVC